MKLTTTLTPRFSATLPLSVVLQLSTLLSQPGAPGVRGSVWYAGVGAPSNALGATNDYYIATDTLCLYGPKTSVWGAAFACIAGTTLAAEIVAALEGATAPGAGNPFVTTEDLTPYALDSDLIATKYAPAVLTIVAGTLVSGTLTDIVSDDGNYIRVNETVDGLTVEVEYQNVADFSTAVARFQYVGGAGHVLRRAIWNWTTSQWDLIGEVTGTQAAFTWFTGAVASSVNYIGTGADSGKVRVHLEHQAPFNTSHYVLIEYAGLVASLGGASVPIPTQTQAENLNDVSGNPFLWPITRLKQFVTAWWATIKTILGQEDELNSPVVTNGSITAINYALGNAWYLDISALTNAHAITLTATNWPDAGKYGAITLVIKTGATLPTIAWPTGWATLVPAVSKTSEYVVRKVGTANARMSLVEAY